MEYYRAKRGCTYRMAIVWLNHYRLEHEAMPPKPLVLDGGEVSPLVRQSDERPNAGEEDGFAHDEPPKYETVVVLYDTDDNGRLIMKDGRRQLGYEVRVWRMTEYHRRALEQINEYFPLSRHDFLVTCHREENQNLEFAPGATRGIWHRVDDIRDDVVGKAETLVEGLLSSEG